MWLTPDHDRHDSNDQWPAFSKQSFSSSQSLHLAGAQMYDARSGWCLVVASVQSLPLHYYFPIHTPIPWYCWAIDYFPRYVYHPSHSQPNVNKNLYRRNILNLSPINHGLLSSSCDYFPNPMYVYHLKIHNWSKFKNHWFSMKMSHPQPNANVDMNRKMRWKSAIAPFRQAGAIAPCPLPSPSSLEWSTTKPVFLGASSSLPPGSGKFSL